MSNDVKPPVSTWPPQRTSTEIRDAARKLRAERAERHEHEAPRRGPAVLDDKMYSTEHGYGYLKKKGVKHPAFGVPTHGRAHVRELCKRLSAKLGKDVRPCG